MCFSYLNSDSEHEEAIKQLSFPATFYKLFRLFDNGKLYPAYGIIGGRRTWGKDEYEVKEGLNKAIQEELMVCTSGGKPQPFTTGFCCFKSPEHSKLLKECFEEIDEDYHMVIKKITISSAEQIAFSGKAKVMAIGRGRVIEKFSSVDMFVFSEMEVCGEE